MKKGKSVFVSLVLACVILASPIVSASENQFYMDYLAGTEAEKPVSSYEISAESYAQKSEAAAVKEVYGENAVYLEHAGILQNIRFRSSKLVFIIFLCGTPCWQNTQKRSR